jgi:sulfopyruvate decarboxylase subunit alpha
MCPKEKLGKLADEAPKIIVETLKDVGVNFVASLPDVSYSRIHELLLKDKSFTYLQVSDEGVGFSACAGAWHGGKKPALVTSNAGLQNMCWAISAWKNMHAPVLMIEMYRGVLGEYLWFMRKYFHKIEQYLVLFDVPYQVINKVEEIRPAIIRAETTCSRLLVPATLLLSGDVMYAGDV